MKKFRLHHKNILAITLIFILLISIFLPAIPAAQSDQINGFGKGIPYQPFIPLKKTTFVNFDKETLIDDYSYLASIPANVFSDGDIIYSNPLLLFQPDETYPDEEKYRFLNDYQGTHYLMEDWISYCNGKLDKLTTINVAQSDLDPNWKSKEHTQINGEDPFEIASEIALDDWSYSNEAVIAVIEEEFEEPKDIESFGEVEGMLSGEVGRDSFTINRPYGPAPEYGYFEIEDEYKYVRVDLWYPSFIVLKKVIGIVPGFGGAGVTLPSVDPDLQIFCKYEKDWLMTAGASAMAITGGPHEKCLSYVYNPGDWRIGVTNMPTEGDPMDGIIHNGILGRGKIVRYGSFGAAIRNLLFGVKNYNIEVTKYPGIEVTIPDLPPFGCRDAEFTLTWDSEDTTLGLTIIGPNGEELESAMEEDTDNQKLHFKQLGECLKGESYRAVIYALEDILSPIDFKVEYVWQQNITRKEADLIASACEGAILGSTINAPLLYVKPNSVPKCTSDTLHKLGVEKIYIIDLGNYLSTNTKNQLSNIGEIEKHYTEYKDIYSKIMDITGCNDIIFSTIDPWSYWYNTNAPGELKPNGEFEEAFYFGPAAYASAHHGSPLLLVDNHPELSGAITWHNNYWQKNAKGYELPSIGPMFLTGSKVQEFLREYGFDKEDAESILTVAGQYDIGPTWSRMFAGVGNPGNIIGTPVDTTNHITRCIFYPGLIFQNPALKGKVELETGSESRRAFKTITTPLQGGIVQRIFPGITEGLSNLIITKPSRIEEFEYPILHTYGCYNHRFNERGAQYWGTPYQTRTGHIPGLDLSSDEIDQGVREKNEGKSGCFLPDLSTTDVGPFYAEKAGYSNAFSTNFDVTIENLNQGVISWYMVLHGDSGMGGWLAWWQPLSETLTNYGVPPRLSQLIGKGASTVIGNNVYESNPWRGYDMMWGSTQEPDSAVLNAEIGILPGWFNIIRDPLNRGLLKTGLDIIPSHTAGYYDGLVGPYSITAMLANFQYDHPATEVDDKLENLHSMNFHAGSCLIGCNYLQIALMRHGTVLLEADPWPTSYWSGYAGQQVAKEFALGKTAGETYAHGLGEVGVKYLFEEDETREWWWDTAENMMLFTDPDLRIWVPSTEWDEDARNHWERDDFQPLSYDSGLSVDGHNPFLVTGYPFKKQPKTFLGEYLFVIIAIVAIIILLLAIVVISRR